MESNKWQSKTLSLRGHTAHYVQLNDTGVPAHFFGANGFPTGTYTQFLTPLLDHYQISSLSLRAMWPNIGPARKQNSWALYADDLIAFLDQTATAPIVAIGHSQGAASSVIAAAKRPDLFQSLILLEPSGVSPLVTFLLRVVPYSIKKYRQPFKASLEKVDQFESREAGFQHFRNLKAFRRISDDVLWDYMHHGLRETEQGSYTLTFAKDWETSNYTLACTLRPYLKKVQLPITVLAGKPSLFFSQPERDGWMAAAPQSDFQVFEAYGHLLPLEVPGLCSEYVLEAAR